MGQHMTGTQGSKTVTTSSTAVPLSTTELWVDILILQAKKVAGDNTGNVFRGDSTLDQGVKEGIEMEPGDYWMWPGSTVQGQSIDLATVYIDADTDGDGVVFEYWK